VVAGVKDLMVCMKETGMEERETFPSTMLRQNTAAMGNTRDHWSEGFTSTRGRSCAHGARHSTYGAHMG